MVADVFPVTATRYYDAAGNLREAVGVRVVPDATYLDAAGNVRGAIGVNIVGGGGDGANVNNGEAVSVRTSSGDDPHPATAVVASGALTGVNLAATVAMVDNGDTFTATGGQTINVAVADGVASMTVESNEPFWEPFTVTAGELDVTPPYYGYQDSLWADGGIQIGSITNEPVAGYKLMSCVAGQDDWELTIAGPLPLQYQLSGATIGVNSEDVVLPIGGAAYYDTDMDAWVTTVYSQDVPPWTLGQQIPIVVIPQ